MATPRQLPTTTFIYALADPRGGELRYVGKANDPAARHRIHSLGLRDTRNDSYRNRWLAGLKGAGLRPLLVILDEVDYGAWPERERHWIAYLRELGARLTNTARGGLGGRSNWTAEQRAAVGEANRKRLLGTKNPEHSARLKGRPLSPEHCAAISVAQRKRPITWRDKINAAIRANPPQLGRSHSAATKAKMSASQRAQWARVTFPVEPRICPTCGGEFMARVAPPGGGLPGKPKTYCSGRCEPAAAARRQASIPATCEWCGKGFQRVPRGKTRRFCSRACQGAAGRAARGIRVTRPAPAERRLAGAV